VTAVVTAKHFSPESTTTTFIDVAGIQVPQTSTAPPLWYASVLVDGKLALGCFISEAQYS
jgi:hypothetical protein